MKFLGRRLGQSLENLRMGRGGQESGWPGGTLLQPQISYIWVAAPLFKVFRIDQPELIYVIIEWKLIFGLRALSTTWQAWREGGKLVRELDACREGVGEERKEKGREGERGGRSRMQGRKDGLWGLNCPA